LFIGNNFEDAHKKLLFFVYQYGHSVTNTKEVMCEGYVVTDSIGDTEEYVNTLPKPDFHDSYVGGLPLETLVASLSKDEYTRQAVFVPNREVQSHQPCIVAVQFIIRGNRLHTVVFQRSGELLRKVPRDFLAWQKVQNDIAFRLGIAPGAFTQFFTSAHYYRKDENYVFELVKKLIP